MKQGYDISYPCLKSLYLICPVTVDEFQDWYFYSFYAYNVYSSNPSSFKYQDFYMFNCENTPLSKMDALLRHTITKYIRSLQQLKHVITSFCLATCQPTFKDYNFFLSFMHHAMSEAQYCFNIVLLFRESYSPTYLLKIQPRSALDY